MTPATDTTRKLSTAEVRRDEVLEAAVPVFAAHGYHGASTVEIAKAAGISQAYVFRLFPTKAELFAAVTDIGNERMTATFREAASAARAAGTDVLDAMGRAYGDLLERDRDVLLIQLHSQVASGSEPLVRDAVRRCFAGLYELVERESGATPEELKGWFAHGMLCNVMAAIDADTLEAPWAQTLAGDEAS
jgi:AcrR family transcriptional regulator